MENKNSAIEKEYAMLREEIMYNQKQRDSLAQFAYTVVVAIFAAAFASNNSWVVLCSIPFIIPMSLRVAECGNTIAYIASYMSTFLEKESGFNWESNHYKYYNKYKRKGIQKVLYYCARWDFAFLTFVSSLLFWLLRSFNVYIHGSLIFGLLLILLQVLAISIEIYISIGYANFPKLKHIMIENWISIKEHK